MELSERVYGNRYLIVVVTVIVISILMAVTLDRLDREMVNAERAQFQLGVAELRASVLLMMAELVAKDNVSEASRFIGSNPMQRMEEPPRFYLGELEVRELAEKEPSDLMGHWVYEPKQQVMMYFPRSDELLFEQGGNGSVDGQYALPPSLKFKVLGLWSEERGQKTITGLKLSAFKQGDWQ